MKEAKKALAFDLGSSNGRAIMGELCDGKLTCQEIHRFQNIPIECEGHLCWDFEKLMTEIIRGIELAGEIDSVGIDAWGADFGILNAEGELLGLPVHYRDSRTNGMIEKATKIITGKQLFYLSGNQIYATNTLYQLLALQETGVWKDIKHIMHIPDLITYFLCGKPVCERTIASTTQMLDPRTGKWNFEILKKFQISEELFSGFVDPGTIVGEYQDKGRRIKVIAVAGHDTQSAGAAMTENSDVTAFLNIGTWSLLGIERQTPILSEEGYTLGISNEQGPFGGIHCIMNIPGLWLMQECKRSWMEAGEIYTYDELDKLAKNSKSCGAILDLYTAGLEKPGNMPEKIQTYCRSSGQNVPNTIGEIVLCIYESLAVKYKEELEKLETGSRKRIEKLQVLGGGARSELFCQIITDICGRDVLAGPIEATALGNLMLQFRALGAVSGALEARKVIRQNTNFQEYHPRIIKK